MLSVSALNRTAVVVADVEQSAKFYSEVLGLEPYFDELDLDPALMPVLIGFMGYSDDRRMRCRFLRSGATMEGMVALFEVTPKPKAIVISDPNVVHLGEACLVFFHPDLDELLPRIEAAGCIIVGPPRALHLPTHEQREMIFRNPDGTLFNIIERSGAVVGVMPRNRAQPR